MLWDKSVWLLAKKCNTISAIYIRFWAPCGISCTYFGMSFRQIVEISMILAVVFNDSLVECGIIHRNCIDHVWRSTAIHTCNQSKCVWLIFRKLFTLFKSMFHLTAIYCNTNLLINKLFDQDMQEWVWS